MYDSTIKAENKIISMDDLSNIFQNMNDTLKKYLRISSQEEMQNRMLEHRYQKYTFQDNGSGVRVHVNFYDNTDITFDTFEGFLGVFYNRVQEIKHIDLTFTLRYRIKNPEPNLIDEYYYQSIGMYITENKMEISLNLKSDDPKLEELYTLIKNTILNAPEKYDVIIKKKTSIINTISFATGLIPAMVLLSILLFVPKVNVIILKGYVVYPIGVIILAFLIGSMVSMNKMERYYQTIMPEKKYAGYDSSRGQSIYEDDIDSFVGTSEILIGKKYNNLENRKMIQKYYDKKKSFLKIGLLVLLGMSVLVIVIGLFIK